MQFSSLQMKRHFISGKVVIGIDPSKDKHDAAVIDQKGLLLGKIFTFQNNHEGFKKQLWIYLNERIPHMSKETTVFAIEAACNLWQKLADYLINQGDCQSLMHLQSQIPGESQFFQNRCQRRSGCGQCCQGWLL